MTIEFYLKKESPWEEIWDVIRTWIETRNSRYEKMPILPTTFPSGSCRYPAQGDSVEIESAADEFTLVYNRHAEGTVWTTRIYLKRATRSIFCRVNVTCADPTRTITEPAIVDELMKRFDGKNRTRPTEPPRVTVTGGVDQTAFEQTLRGVVEPRFDKLDSDHKKQSGYFATIKSALSNFFRIVPLIEPNKRMRGLENVREPKKSQILEAIHYSWECYPVLPVQSDAKERAKNKGKPTIASLAKVVWDRKEAKWALVPDSYQTYEDYKSALIAQAKRNPASFSYLDED